MTARHPSSPRCGGCWRVEVGGVPPSQGTHLATLSPTSCLSARGGGWFSIILCMIGFIVAGLIIGALARLLKPGKQDLGIVATLLLGLTGAVIGGGVASLLGTGDIFELNILGFIVAVIAAILLVGVAERMTGSRRT